MSDRGLLFLGSLLIVLASLGCSVWLIATGQAAYLDGLFLLLTCLVMAFAFALYCASLIRRALDEADEDRKAAGKAAAGPAQKRGAPASKEGVVSS